ncbi:MAG: penicillin acylase family protein [Pseudomonadota bacterium]
MPVILSFLSPNPARWQPCKQLWKQMQKDSRNGSIRRSGKKQTQFHSRLLASLMAAVLVLLTACSDSDSVDTVAVPPPPPPPAPMPILSADIRRTEFGIPHIQANDWESLGYGFGYAYAQDNYCIAMREIVFALGRSAELLGEEDGNVGSDFLFQFLNGDKEAFEQEFVTALPQFARDLAAGFTEGMNRYLRDTGVENLPGGELGCRDADWVFEFDMVDYILFLRREALRGSADQGIFRQALLAVTGPDALAGSPQPLRADFGIAREQIEAAAKSLRPDDQGSNALVLGSDATQTSTGILLGNPHQPWFGSGAWYQAHLTIPGELDVAGAALHGYPFIGIGFNENIAWTHTVSFANRFTLFELPLNPENPLQYDFNGEWVDFEQDEVTIQVRLADGTLEPRSFTFYVSQYGPVLNLEGLSPLLGGWPMFNGSVLVFRDANLATGVRGITQWIQKSQATTTQEYVDALAGIGNPVFHEFAVDRNGDGFYGEISAIPLVTQEQLDTCVRGVVGPLLSAATGGVIVSLDGSDPACDWGNDPESPEGSNVYPASRLPQFFTRDYVSNSNNSYWLSDADNPLEGFPSIMGPVGGEGQQQFLRTRIGHLMVRERRAATDGLDDAPLFNLENVKAYMYENRVHGAEVVLDDVLTVCSNDTPAAAGVQDVCAVLESWDRRVNVDSVGAQIFTEFWGAIGAELGDDFQGVVVSDEFWLVDYDPTDPINTPSGIDLSIEANHTRVIAALDTARSRLEANGVPIDANWGDIQYLERGADRVAIHGGDGVMGVYGAIAASLREGGYVNPRGGNSYIQAVTWDESVCPIADVVLVPSQSTDPESPHFADQTRLYSAKEWLRFPFCEADIQAAQIGETLTLEAFE